MTKSAGLRIKVDGKWLHVGESTVFKHPGGPVITQYSNADATHIFHAFHSGSEKAYKQLTALKSKAWDESEDLEELQKKRVDKPDVNISAYDISIEEEKQMALNFEKLRAECKQKGMLEGAPLYYIWKIVEIFLIWSLVVYFQRSEWYILSACCLAVMWSQLGWLAHEFCHQQPFKDRVTNDYLALFLGNFCQGFCRDWWKDKHNTHHAATNIVDHDGDINIVPVLSLIPSDLKKYKQPIEKFILKFIPYQHLYFTMMLPILRVSWTTQSILFAFSEQSSEFRVYRRNALSEQVALVLHWSWVLFQLYLLPTNTIRILFFLISQLGSGLIIAHVVTYSHNSVDKYPANSRLLNNFAALQILTTRNMNPSPFIDWVWGGLNYQIEHHLFPTMPRCYLKECSKMVKRFCADNNLPYLCDDYMTGYRLNLEQLEKIALLAAEQ